MKMLAISYFSLRVAADCEPNRVVFLDILVQPPTGASTPSQQVDW